jgi:hypothetical protein
MSDYYGALSIASNVLSIVGYFPEIYSMMYNVECQNMWAIWIASGGLGITYGACIDNPYVIMTSCISTGMCLIIFSVKKWRKAKNAANLMEIEEI